MNGCFSTRFYCVMQDPKLGRPRVKSRQLRAVPAIARFKDLLDVH